MEEYKQFGYLLFSLSMNIFCFVFRNRICMALIIIIMMMMMMMMMMMSPPILD